MRELANSERIEQLMQTLAAHAGEPTRVYLAGGATAVLMGWRNTTIDVDMRVEPETDEILRAIPEIKESLQINIEFATPLDFIPVVSDWRERSTFITAHGNISYFHFDLNAQALAKVERGHTQDLADLEEMIGRGLVTPGEAVDYFKAIEVDLFKYPSLDPESFRGAVLSYFGR